MKVLHVIPSLSASQGGPTVAMGVFERSLSHLGMEVHTVTTDDDGPGKRNEWGDQPPVTVRGATRHFFRKDTEFYKYSSSLSRWLKLHVAEFDLVHVHALFSHSSIAAGRAAVRHQKPLVIRPYGVLNRYGITQRRPWLKKLSLALLEGPLLKAAGAIHFTSKEEAEQAALLKIPLRGVVIPLGLEPLALPEPEPKRPATALYLSRLNPVKNLENLIRAWSSVTPSFPTWRLQIAGDGDAVYVDSLKHLAESLGHGQTIDWIGQVEGAAKAQLMANASLFVLPSHSENFGLAAAEALLAGKACLLSPGVAVGQEAKKEGAAMIRGPAADDLNLALRELMGNEMLRLELGRRAALFANSFLSADTMARKIRSLYETLIDKKDPKI